MQITNRGATGFFNFTKTTITWIFTKIIEKLTVYSFDSISTNNYVVQ